MPYFILAALISLTAILYYPGLSSDFILDDFPNLYGLEYINSAGLLNFVFDDVTGSLGRPLSLFTFALQHADWPLNPFAFKLVNLVIHLANGVLIFLICNLLARPLGIKPDQGSTFSLLVTALWLLHPMQISTVLYAVQRMTQLSALFTLIGIYGYLYVRSRYQGKDELRGLVYCSFIIVFSGIFAVLSKENGILLPLFVFIVEFFAISGPKKTGSWRLWAWLFLALPLVLLALYLATNFGATLRGYEMRPFTISQRLMTEAVILVEYMRNLILPHPSAFTLFHDNYPVSFGLFSPPATIISIIIIFSLLISSFLIKRKTPIIAFGIFWFFAGHLLESTYLNLELYFEHRNYVPSLGILMLEGYFFIYVYNRIKNRPVVYTLIGSFYLLVVSIMFIEIRVWANPVLQAAEWVRVNPDSRRALNNLGFYYLINYKNDEALEVFEKFSRKYPADIYPYIKNISITYCIKQNGLDDEEWQNIYIKANEARWYGNEAMAELDFLVMSIRKDLCQIPEIVNLMRVMLILGNNPEYKSKKDELHELVAMLCVYIGDIPSALANIREAVRLSSRPYRYNVYLRILLAAGLYNEANEVLEQYKQEYKLNPKVYLSNKEIISEIEQKLQEAATEQP